MNNSLNITVSNKQAEDILLSQYGLKGHATQLPGYVDYNFKVTTSEHSYILKVSRPESGDEAIVFLKDILLHLEKDAPQLTAPRIIPDKGGRYISEFVDVDNTKRSVRLLSWISGRVWHQVNPRLDDLHFSLGENCGQITKALQSFEHPNTHRDFEWDTAQALWTKRHLGLFSQEEREIITHFQDEFEKVQSSYGQLRKSIVHNDANDHNIIVSEDLEKPKVKCIIDYGDTIHTQIINDVAIACTYAIMSLNDPLEAALPIVSGYHSQFPLNEDELKYLYISIAMRLVISFTSSTINKRKEPENHYLQISAQDARDLLKKWRQISPDFAQYNFRLACGYSAHPNSAKFLKWSEQQNFSIKNLFPTAHGDKIKHIDLSVSSTWLGHEYEIADLDLFQFKVDRLQAKHPDCVLAGGYLEPRMLYTSTAYDKQGNSGLESRTVHLGLDFWFPPNTPVHALFDGEVVTACNDSGDKEYGGLVILKHQIDDFEFYTLYGHNTVASATQHQIGDKIKKGDKIAELGDSSENGNWVPHLHFQIMLSMLDYQFDFPGVTYPNQLEVWKGICPDPNLLFHFDELKPVQNDSVKSLVEFRNEHLGKSLSLQYNKPLHIVRGSGVYLIDQLGRKYLDTVNNVAHVGHEHPAVVKAGQQQMALLNTNTRYLHQNINKLAQSLQATLPPELSVLHFVNSGSEANELAIRMARAVTNQKDVIVSEVGYHGNTNICVDISSYKFDGKGGKGAPEHTHVFPIPDAFRGKYKGVNSGDMYVEEVQNCIQNIHRQNRNVSAFIIEPILSCGGQIELPNGFLKKAYKLIRDEGGVCISDEVQTGCGRMGKTFWGFQLHNVIPDIVTIGKPLGNGHPVAAVACTPEIAEAFANGMEYFNTFGGNPVSCAIATSVLDTVKVEGLQDNALEIGEYLKDKLKAMARDFPIIGEVRGQGLFLGIELVDDKLNPLPEKTNYLINRMKEHGILTSCDGPDLNVIKIKPPLDFNKDNADLFISYLGKILAEDYMRLNTSS